MSNVLVLNSDFSPLNIQLYIGGFILVNKGKARNSKKGR